MKKIFFSLAALLMLAVTLVSCGGESPKATAEKFLNGLYHMDYAAAKSVSTEATKKQVEAYEQMMSGFGGEQAKEEAKKVKVDVKEPKIEGETATVEYTLSSNPTPQTLRMKKEGGKWLADWSKMDMGGGAGGTDTTTPTTEEPSMTPDTTTAAPADGMTAPDSTMNR